MEFAAHQLQKIKLGTHIGQAVLILVAWILEITVFRSSATIDGRIGWYFGLVCRVSSLFPPLPVYMRRIEVLICTIVLSHNTSINIPHHDPSISTYQEIRQPIRSRYCRRTFLPLMVNRLRSPSKFQLQQQMRGWLWEEQGSGGNGCIYMVSLPKKSQIQASQECGRNTNIFQGYFGS